MQIMSALPACDSAVSFNGDQDRYPVMGVHGRFKRNSHLPPGEEAGHPTRLPGEFLNRAERGNER